MRNFEQPHRTSVNQPLSTITPEKRKLLFKAFALEYILEAHEAAPLAATIRPPTSLQGASQLENDELFLLARATARWLLLNSYITSSEKQSAKWAFDWHEGSRQASDHVLYDAIITDKGLTAIGKVMSFTPDEHRSLLDGLTTETIRETIKSVIVDGVKAAPSVALNLLFGTAFL